MHQASESLEDNLYAVYRAGKPLPRSVLYAAEHNRTVNTELMRSVDRDAFLAELEIGTEVSAELIKASVRAFATAALKRPEAATPDGWQRACILCKRTFGTALSLAVADARFLGTVLEARYQGTDHRGPVPSSAPIVPPLAPWQIRAYESRKPTEAEVQTDRLYWQGLPVRLLETLIRAHTAARLREPEATTPEGRSRVLGSLRRLLWDALLDAVKTRPCPRPQPSLSR